MNPYSIARKLHVGGLILTVAAPFCRKRTDMPVDEARRVLNDFFPRRNETALQIPPRTWHAPEMDVSVVIACYNTGRYGEEAVRSALEQKTAFSFEVIVVNDGSTDEIATLLAAFKDPRLRVITQENRGLSEARNVGLNAARGEYICFLDGDDILLPGALEALVGCAREHDADMVQGSYRMMDENSVLHQTHTSAVGRLDPVSRMNGFVWAKVMRRELFAKTRYPGRICFQDTLTMQVICPLVALRQKSAWGIAQPVVGYRYNLAGFSQTYLGTAKSVDTVWVTEIMREARVALGLTDTQADYEHLLDMAGLSFRRTSGIENKKIQEAVFVMYCDFAKQAGQGRNTRLKRQRLMEKALRDKRYGLYKLVSRLG